MNDYVHRLAKAHTVFPRLGSICLSTKRSALVLVAAFTCGTFGLQVGGAAPADTDLQQKVAGYRNSKRVLVVFAPSSQDGRFQAQQKLWQGERKNFPDYDLVEVPAFTSDAPARALAKHYGVKEGEFAVLLVGKDGNVAYQTAKPVEAADLYERINAMPMRRDEQSARSR